MLVDQVIPIKTTEQPKETTLRFATITQLRELMNRVELSYSQGEPGKVLLVSLCADITLMIPVEKPLAIDACRAETILKNSSIRQISE